MKKLLSLILTLALMSTMLVFGGVSASAAETETVTPDMVLISSTVADDVTTQVITYYPSTTDFGTSYTNLISSYEPAETWMFLRFPLSDFASVSEAALTLKQRFNTQAYARIHTLDADTWNKATTGLTDNTKTILSTDGDVFTDPMGSNQAAKSDTIFTIKSSSTTAGVTFTVTSSAESNTSTTGTYTTGTSGPLLTYINNSLDEDYLYFAYTMSPTTDNDSSKKCRFYAGSTSLSLTGTRAEEVPFSDAEITWDGETGTCTIATATTTGTAKLIVASFNGATMNDAKVVEIDAATDAAEGVITKTITDLADGTLKIFLWDSTTLAPAIGVTTPSAAE